VVHNIIYILIVLGGKQWLVAGARAHKAARSGTGERRQSKRLIANEASRG
jgi:hypothetical protein